MRPPRAAAVAAFVVIVTLSGCLGGEARSEWAFDITQIDGANAAGKSGAGIRVGILDTGVNVGHPSLDHLVDGDPANGELVGFRDYIRQRFGVENAYDDIGHGSHVVGIMAGRGSTFQDKVLYGGIDLQGGSPSAGFYVAKVCDQEGCPQQAIDDALEWMGQNRVQVVSLSLGGTRAPLQFNDAVRTEINTLIDRGTVVIASAGNDGPNNSDVNAPADIPGVIAVGAVNPSGGVWSGSSRGDNGGANACRQVPFGGSLGRCYPDQKPELVAPGVEILSAWTGDDYVRATGTSQAAPFVASVVALMLEGRPTLRDRDDVEQVKEVLADTARPVSGQQRPHDDAAGYGIVQAVDALRQYGSL